MGLVFLLSFFLYLQGCTFEKDKKHYKRAEIKLDTEEESDANAHVLKRLLVFRKSI